MAYVSVHSWLTARLDGMAEENCSQHGGQEVREPREELGRENTLPSHTCGDPPILTRPTSQ